MIRAGQVPKRPAYWAAWPAERQFFGAKRPERRPERTALARVAGPSMKLQPVPCPWHESDHDDFVQVGEHENAYHCTAQIHDWWRLQVGGVTGQPSTRPRSPSRPAGPLCRSGHRRFVPSPPRDVTGSDVRAEDGIGTIRTATGTRNVVVAVDSIVVPHWKTSSGSMGAVESGLTTAS